MRARLLVPVALVAVTTAGCQLFDPLERDQEDAGITITVDRCEQDETTEIVNASFTVTSEEDYDVVLIDGKLKDATETVVASSSTSVSNVAAGERHQGNMVLSPSGSYETPLECELELNFAQRPVFE